MSGPGGKNWRAGTVSVPISGTKLLIQPVNSSADLACQTQTAPVWSPLMVDDNNMAPSGGFASASITFLATILVSSLFQVWYMMNNGICIHPILHSPLVALIGYH